MADRLKVLLATDGSESAIRAAAFAARLLEPHRSVDVTVLYVEPATSGPVLGAGAIGPLEEARLHDQVQEVEAEVLRQTAELLDAHGLETRVRLEIGSPAHVIARLVVTEGYDMLVIGRGRQGELQTFLLGDVDAAVLRNVRVPILLVS